MNAILKAALAAAAAGGAGVAAWAYLRDSTADTDVTGETVKNPVATSPGSQSLGERAVAVLGRMNGAKGSGPKGTAGYHRGPVVDQIQRGLDGMFGDKLLGQPWCGLTAVYGYEVGARELGRPAPFPAKMARSLAVAENWAGGPLAAFKISTPKVGCAVVMKTSVGYHVGLVAQALGPTRFVSVEGNHGDKLEFVARTLDLSKMSLVDVEAWVLAQQGPAAAKTFVGALPGGVKESFAAAFPRLAVGEGPGGSIAARARTAADLAGVPDAYRGVRVDKAVVGPVVAYAPPAGVPPDATAWDETGWWTRGPVAPLVDCVARGEAFARAASERTVVKTTVRRGPARAWIVVVERYEALPTMDRARVTRESDGPQGRPWDLVPERGRADLLKSGGDEAAWVERFEPPADEPALELMGVY